VTWYTAYTQPGKERWARSNLWERGFEVYLPEYLKVRRHARRVDEVARPLFPRYLFLRPVPGAPVSIRKAITAQGVVDLVRMGKEIPRLADRVIQDIRSREAQDGLVRLGRSPLKPGQRIRVVGGAMEEHIGIFECRDDQQRVIVLFNMLGRRVRVQASADAVVPDLA